VDDESRVFERDDGMNEAVENVCVSENDDETLRGRRARLPCKDRQGVKETGVPAKVPGAFVVGLGEVLQARGLEELGGNELEMLDSSL